MATILGAIGMVYLGGCSTAPQTFSSPQTAVDSLVEALRADDQEGLKRILGSESDELLFSGDEISDAQDRTEFLRLFDEKHELKSEANDLMTLEVGATEWPMPIPVVNGKDGWYFDTLAGLDEVLSRRIGRNELSTMQVCLAIVDAQREYASKDSDDDGLLEYARKVKSDPGQKNGLYWPVPPGEAQSPLGELVAEATLEGYTLSRPASPRRPYHGYHYRLLTEQGPAAPGGAMKFVAGEDMIGGFGVVAWPAEYANSGLKTFIVSHHGVVYERDLGDGTDRAALSMQAFNPDSGWERSDTTQALTASEVD